MGYWNSDEEGRSFRGKLLWGDAPADVIDKAIADVVAIFQRDLGRVPSKETLLAGFKFSLGGYEAGPNAI